MNDLRLQPCQEDCKVPHASPFSFVNFCKSRIFGNDEGLNPSCSFSLSSCNPLLHSVLVVPRIYRDEHHVVYLFFDHEIGDCQGVEFLPYLIILCEPSMRYRFSKRPLLSNASGNKDLAFLERDLT